MPNCDFYATPVDHESLLSWLFEEGACHVYELSSEFERPLQRFTSSAEVIAQFDRQFATGEKWGCVYLLLYVLGAGPPFIPRRVSLNPEACNGATYRFAAEGWGLVQLYLESPTQHGLKNSHSNHFTQKGAAPWESLNSDQPGTDSWDFKRITSFSSRLNREIRKRSVAKLGSCPVLPDALRLWQAGAQMLPFTDADMEVDQRKETVNQE